MTKLLFPHLALGRRRGINLRLWRLIRRAFRVALAPERDDPGRHCPTRAYAEELGRPESLTISFSPFARDDDLSVYAELGVDWLTVGFDACTTRAEWLDRLGEFAARVR